MLQCWNFLLNTNIYISLAAVLLTLATQVQLGMRPQFHPYLFLLFFATLFDYNLHRLITVLTNKAALQSEKHRWVKAHLKQFYVMMGLSVLGFLWAVLDADKKVLLTLTPFAILTLFYSLPVFKSKKNIFRLRDIAFLKIFLIAIVWSASTIFLPVIQGQTKHAILSVGLLFIERFLFIFAITIPFDIRDMAADSQQGLKTIPLVMGKKNALTLANIALVCFTGLSLLHYNQPDFYRINIALAVSALSSFIFINNKKLQQVPFYHYGILDGTMLLQGILVLAAYYLT